MIIFAGGGTGGHLTPGLAVAEALRDADPREEIVFVGTDRPLELSLIPIDYGHRELPVESTAMLSRNPVRFAWNNVRAYRMAAAMLREEPPRAVVGLGGFASVPVVLAAWRQRVPVILLEQNAIPGRATRWLARFARRICVSFEKSVKRLRPGPIVVTGNPVRRGIAELIEMPAGSRSGTIPTLLVLGGSQGAQPLNEALMRLVERGLPVAVRIVHQTGQAHVARVSATYEACGVPHEVASFFHDMPERYRTADVIVSRAGATTLAEIACAGKPSVLVPYPHAADNHQWHNAKAFADAGAAALVLQDEDPAVTAEELSVAVGGFLCSPDRAAIAEAAAQTLARPDAAQRVAEQILAVTG